MTGATKPFWLVMGQSWNPGWTASVNGQPLGAPVAINGYANGWYVDPQVVGTGPLAVTMVWTPQRLVWIFIGLSVLTGLLCVGLMFLAGRRRREPEPLVPDPLRPIAPSLALPWLLRRFDPLAPAGDGAGIASRRTALLAAIVFGVAVGLNTTSMYLFPLLGVPGAVLLYAALRHPRSRSLLGLAGAASLALAGTYYVVLQRKNRFNPNFVWPTQFNRVHILGLLAMFLLGAEALREVVLHRRRATTAGPADDPVPDPDPPTA